MDDLPFHPAAALEAVEASTYLEEARVGYSEKFEAELDRLCGRIAEHPRSGSPLDGYPSELDVRSYRMDVFRYSLIVVTIEGAPMVLAVAHHGRKPGYWRDRLE